METEPHMVKALPPDSVLRLQDVVYTYREEDGAGETSTFVLGPINAEIRTGKSPLSQAEMEAGNPPWARS